MTTTDTRNRLARFQIPGRVSLREGHGGLPKLALTSEWSTAEVYPHGAHVTDFRRHGEPPVLFMSQCSQYAAGRPIRGGIPIILPWFGSRKGEGTHGFARLVEWELHEASTVPEGGVSLRFGLPNLGGWPPFLANYIVTITDRLSLELILTNVSPDAECLVETCLHTYFQVGEISAVSIEGLEGLPYLDELENFAEKPGEAEAVRIAGEVDRIYLDTAAAVRIRDERLRRTIRVEKDGAASTVVWNPWVAKSRAMADFGDEEYHQMVCVESGNVKRNRLALAPGKSSALKLLLSAEPL